MDKKVTAADFMQGPGRPEYGIFSMEYIIEAYYGSIDNFYQCEFVHKGAIEDAYRNSKSQIEKWAVIRRYYEFVQPKIDREKHWRWAVVYDLPFDDDFSPIERDAWHCFRCLNVVMYPQYPALGYFLDFANPKIKLAIEMDGKEWHDAEKDRIRDGKLTKAGWKIYRIKGAECYTRRDYPEDLREKYEQDAPEYRRGLRAFYCETVEGVIRAIKHAYFQRYENPDYYAHQDIDFMDETLHRHRSYGRCV